MTEELQPQGRALAILSTVDTFIKENGFSPSTRELIELTGFSFGSLAYHLRRLEGEGRITRVYKMARSIRVV